MSIDFFSLCTNIYRICAHMIKYVKRERGESRKMKGMEREKVMELLKIFTIGNMPVSTNLSSCVIKTKLKKERQH